VTGLLPDAVRDAIASRGDFGASASFGLVTLDVLIALLVEHELLRAASAPRARLVPLFIATTALSFVVVLNIAVRIGDLLP
jgi:hypothetical protein